MKLAANIVGALLGLAFIAFSVMFLFNLVPPQPPPPEGSPVAMFMGAFATTGYMHFVKICELIGGILVAIPFTRNIGLLFLGPVILNIIAFHAFVAKAGVTDPPLIVICLMAAFLLWAGRHQFAGLLVKPAARKLP